MINDYVTKERKAVGDEDKTTVSMRDDNFSYHQEMLTSSTFVTGQCNPYSCECVRSCAVEVLTRKRVVTQKS